MSKRILTVDDSKVMRMMIKNALKDSGFEILEASCGQEGIESAAKNQPDLIILDITMPDLNGIEVLEHLRKSSSNSKTPVIMLTAESDEKTVQRASSLGVSGYIAKPFTIDRVTKAVAQVLN
jgi:CheY-like chemotaxis protein